jgi:hypothetical protein
LKARTSGPTVRRRDQRNQIFTGGFYDVLTEKRLTILILTGDRQVALGSPSQDPLNGDPEPFSRLGAC